jgi:hypothetical protein
MSHVSEEAVLNEVKARVAYQLAAQAQADAAVSEERAEAYEQRYWRQVTRADDLEQTNVDLRRRLKKAKSRATQQGFDLKRHAQEALRRSTNGYKTTAKDLEAYDIVITDIVIDVEDRTTFVAVQYREKDDTLSVGSGHAVCGTNDTFNSHTGLLIAFYQAVDNLVLNRAG